MAGGSAARQGHATWFELCVDTAQDTPDLGRFWAAAVGGRHEATAGDPAGYVRVDGREGASIAMCPVPEPRSVKHRVHLDVYTSDVADLEARGASMLAPAADTGFGWSVMADPEGGEFCAFVRAPADLPAYRLHGIVVDSTDPERIAAWWGERFGRAPQRHSPGPWWTLEQVTPDPVLTVDFVPVPEPKRAKNRVHWDVHGEVAGFEAAGAQVLWTQPGWTVMADPEGNEFCVFPRH